MSLNVRCYYDTGLSQMYFDDNFEILRYSGNRYSSILNYIDYGNMEKFDVDFYRLSKNDIVEYLGDNNCTMKNTKDELIDYLCDSKDYEILIDLPDDLVEKLGFCVMSSSGYSQGDYSYILINTIEFEKITGNKFDSKEYQKHFDHLLWDAPVSINFDIQFDIFHDDGFKTNYGYDTIDFYADEYLSDSYDIESLNVEKLVKTILNDLILSDEQIQELTEKFESLDYEDIKWL